MGFGFAANTLTLGCDCVGHIAYLDAMVSDEDGEPSSAAVQLPGSLTLPLAARPGYARGISACPCSQATPSPSPESSASMRQDQLPALSAFCTPRCATVLVSLQEDAGLLWKHTEMRTDNVEVSPTSASASGCKGFALKAMRACSRGELVSL